MSQDAVRYVLASSVANGGTFVVGYLTNRDAGNYVLGTDHYIISNKYGSMWSGGKVAFAFGAAGITITNNSGVTLDGGTEFYVNLDAPGVAEPGAPADPATMFASNLILINLGAPDVAVANGVCASQAINTGTPGTINGSLAASGVATFDVPRAIVAAWTNAAVMTVTGIDAYGKTVIESSASGTSFAGKKAFKAVTKVEVSANVTGATVGTGDVIGLPSYLPSTGCVLREMQDGAPATAGTLLAGVRSAATATTGDVRGTYDPNAACDGARMFSLLVAVPNPGDRGVTQFGS